MTQFMQVSMSNHKRIESAIKNLEIQVGQLAKQIAENSSGGFGANTKKNPKEEFKVVVTKSKRGVFMEDGSRSNERDLGAKEEKEKEGEQTREKKISEVDEGENVKNNKKRESEGVEKKESEDKKIESELVMEKKKEVVPNS